ncbi:MAG: DinB family protein [Phycisphaerales bacterium JB039]
MSEQGDTCAWFGRLIEWDTRAIGLAIDSIQSARDHLERGGEAAEAAPVVKAIEIMAHVLCARRIWLSRLGVGDPPEEIFPPAWPMDRLRAEAGEIAGLWRGYASRLTAAELGREAQYRSTEGSAWVTRIDDILLHVLTHSHYHRGQIARLVAEAGGEPAATDYVLGVRTAAKL